MALEEYRDPILKELIDMLEAQGPEQLRGHYVYGDVLMPAKSLLPCVSVAKQGTVIQSDGTMQDVHVSGIVMAVIYDWTTDLDQSFDLTRGTTGLYKLIEEREEDSTSQNYLAVKERTLAYALRKNQKLADNLFISIRDEGLRVDYGLGWEKRGDNIFSVEGILRFNIELTQKKPNLY
jgi:hypothetical protein